MFLTGLFRMARKRVQTTDNDMGMFREKLEGLVAKKDSLSDEDVSAKVEELKAMAVDLPDGDDKSKLERFLDDFKGVKGQDEATAKEAASMVADLFEKLDTEAMKDAPAVEEVEETEKVDETEETSDGCKDAEAGEAKEDEPEKKDGKDEVKDGDEAANAEYTLEEIYQFIKKRMAEDAEASEEPEEEKEEVAEEEEEVVTDNAPRIPVTIGESKAQGSLGAMFAKIKEGGR